MSRLYSFTHHVYLFNPYSLYPLSRSTALGSALLAGSAIHLFGWDINKPETLNEVNTSGSRTFNSKLDLKERELRWKGWQKAVERSREWDEGLEED